MAVALGGRIAEELIFGEDDITTGAGGDFQQVRPLCLLASSPCVSAALLYAVALSRVLMLVSWVPL